MNEWSRLTITVTARLFPREQSIFIPRRPTALCLTAASHETEKTTCSSCVASKRSILAKGRRFHDTGKDCDPLDAEIVGAVFRSVSPPIYLYCSIRSIFLPDLEECKQRINYEEAGALIYSRESPKHERDSSGKKLDIQKFTQINHFAAAVELNIEAEIIFRKRLKLFVKMARDTWKKLTLSKIIQSKDKNVYASPKIDSDVKPVESCGSPSFSSDSPSSKRLSETKSRLGSMIFNDCNPSNLNIETFRIFVATWNVGGNTPHNGLNLGDDFLPANDHSDIYVLGFQEIVPLNAGNVLVIEDNEPASKWLYLINQALNGSDSATDDDSKPPSPYINSMGSKASKNQVSFVNKTLRTDQGRLLKACNCPFESSGKYYRESCFRCQSNFSDDDLSEEEEESSSYSINQVPVVPIISRQRYSLIASKQMVGIFVTVWVRSELVQHIGHLRLSCVGRGIMRYFGNKGCISVSMSLHQTTFCFVCSHLASGEKEGDELRRNSDVSEILKHTQFRKVCRRASLRIPVKILDHDYVIWLGDLNYRIALSYAETKKLLEVYNWDALLEKDQLKTEREAGRVFKGWNEGKIYFGPTYKYSNNSDTYAGEIVTSKKKRRTPAWCDRILWHGDGIELLSYIRGESKFSDHRPVCASFVVEVGVSDRLKNGLSTHNMKVGVEELLPPSTN